MEFTRGSLALNRYRIDTPIDEGGFAKVYAGWDQEKNRPVAVKVLRPEAAADQVALARFLSECRSLIQLPHKNVVQIYDMGSAGDSHILVMELCRSSIHTEMRATGPTVDRAFEIAIATCDALAAIHEKGIIHRDVKPSNILISQDGWIKLADLGIAHSPFGIVPWQGNQADIQSGTASPMTVEGTQPGTFLYMSPEQLLGQRVAPSSDIYSLGATLYEYLTQRHYLSSANWQNLVELSRAILTQCPPAIHGTLEVPRSLDDVILRALDKDPGRRFQSALEMGRVIRGARRRVGFLRKVLAVFCPGKVKQKQDALFLCANGHRRPTFGCRECIKIVRGQF